MGQEFCVKCMKPVVEGAGCTCGFDKSKYFVDSYHLIPGSILNDRYYVGVVLGEGGFGITYVGMDLMLRRKVAIKEYFLNGYANRTTVTSSEIITKPGEKHNTFLKYMEGFLDEGRTMAKFAEEKNIVSIYDFFKVNNTAYIVMEFLEGETLGNYCKNKGFISYDEMLKIFVPLVNVLENIHKENVIHRDISPDNIIINPSGEAKLLDFGAARSFEKDVQHTMSVILKPGYAPMEQYGKKSKQGPWTDIYALSATMYYCLTGVVPGNAIERYQEDEVKPICDMVSGCPESCSEAIMKGMAVRIENRYQSMGELRAALITGGDDPIIINGEVGNNPKPSQYNPAGNARGVNPVTQRSRVITTDPESERLAQLRLTEKTLPQRYSWNDIAWNQSSMDPTGLYRVNYNSEIGDIVTFSFYNWIVLAKQGNRMMLISEDPIVMLPYHILSGDQPFQSATWGESYLRKWLNTEFYNSFSDIEKHQVQLTLTSNAHNGMNRTGISQDTIDSVFILNRDEAVAYNIYKNKVKFNGKKGGWWLRNNGLSPMNAAVVRANGKIDDGGMAADELCGVRPVIMISF